MLKEDGDCMFRWFPDLFNATYDKTEENLKKLFGFLLNDYDFKFSKEILEKATDKNGKFFFCGPLNLYQFYNENVCINILHLVQRDDCNVYVTDQKSKDQMYIRSGYELPARLAYDSALLAKEIKQSVLNRGEIFGYKIHPDR